MKMDVNSYFQTHTPADFERLERKDYVSYALDSAPANGSPQEQYKALQPIFAAVGTRPGLLWKHYITKIGKRFPGLDKRWIEKEIAGSVEKKDTGSDSGGKFLPMTYVEQFKSDEHIINCNGQFHAYRDGYHQRRARELIDQKTIRLIGPEVQAHQVDSVRKFLAIDTYVPPESVNEPGQLNLRNGILDIQSGNGPESHSPERIHTIRINVNYDPKADCPRWGKFLDEVLPERDKQDLLGEVFAYSLTADTSLHRGFMFHGDGSNGKTVTAEVLMALVGPENCSHLELKDFGHRFRTASLLNKLVNVCSESDSNALVSDSEIKKIIGGDPIMAEYKGQDPFVFRPVVKIIVLCNALPLTNDRSLGWKRRWEIIPFEVEIPDDPKVRDRHLAQNLVNNELSGILNWTLGAYKRLRTQGTFTIPESSRQAKRQYERQIAPELAFCDEWLRKGTKEDKASLPKIYEKYKTWCAENGHSPLSKQKLHVSIRREFKVKEPKGQRDEEGITIPRVVFLG